MKKLFNILLICSCILLMSQNTFAQNATIEHSVQVIAQSKGNYVQLRWGPSDYETWKKANTVGYKVERYTSMVDGVQLSFDETQLSYQLLESNLAPLGESQWTSNFNADNAFAQVAKGTLYESDSLVVTSSNPTLADAINTKNSNDSRFTFALFAADQDFNVAVGLALAYTDYTIEAGRRYYYIITLNENNANISAQGGTKVDSNDVLALPAPEITDAEGLDKEAIIGWGVKDLYSFYTTYDIERSTDGVNFTKVNDLPFVYGKQGGELPENMYYKDVLPENGIAYHYRIKGRTPFGESGPPSDATVIEGRPAPMIITFKIDSVAVTEDQVTLRWDNFPTDTENPIRKFKILRSKESYRFFEPINNGPIFSTERSFTDDSPLLSGYYRLEAIDIYGNKYQSISEFVQLKDSIPPSIPTGLTAEFITSKKTMLSWDANTEEDLKGYRLYMGNFRDGNYTQMTKYPEQDENLVFEIDPTFVVDSIYFKIASLDFRENTSELSAPIALARPDVTAPDKPILQKVKPTPLGIELGFSFSSSDDVVRHELQRKPKDAPGWEVVLYVSKEDEIDYIENLTPESITSTNYMDTEDLERRPYQYRLLSFDEEENTATSKLLEVTPYDSKVRGTIENFGVGVECVPSDVLPNQGGYDALEALLDTYQITDDFVASELQQLVIWNVITNSEYNSLLAQSPYEVNLFLENRKIEIWGDQIEATTELTWVYTELEQLVDFHIFRSAEGSGIMPYKTLPIETLSSFIYQDTDVKSGRRYFYQIMARHEGGGFSPLSNVITVLVP